MELSGQKEKLFERYSRGELPYDQLVQQVYAIDHPAPHWTHEVIKTMIAAFLPLLFIPTFSDHSARHDIRHRAA
jgi:hypothetical protein